ncbi:MAG: zinc-binding dehydrogenase [Acidobacteriota bacterium]|nr:zinc-binding dehydrogenase [Acidobacteriota bacterium]
MRAAIFREHGGIDKLEIADIPQPTPKAGEVVVRVRAAAMNHLDLWVRRGLPGVEIPLPHVGGSDIAGEVVELGAQVSNVEQGARVVVNPGLWCGVCEWCLKGEHSLCVDYRIIGEHTDGGFAEFVAVPAANCSSIPENFSFEEAAAVPLVFLTAWRALITQANLRAGERVLVLGASGGVASAAIQIAKLAGARVLAVTSSAEKAAQARELGADEIIDRTQEDFAKQAFKLTNRRGVDVVLENTGAETWEGSLRALTRGGRLVTYGGTTGPNGKTNIPLLFWKQIHLIGSTMGTAAEFARVTDLVWQRRLRPVVDRVLPLTEIKAAHEALEAGEQFGKIVLTP